jgi:hypothetical protein
MLETVASSKLINFHKWQHMFNPITLSVVCVFKKKLKKNFLNFIPLFFINFNHITNVYIYMYYGIIFFTTYNKFIKTRTKTIYLMVSQPRKQLFLYFIFPNYSRCWTIGGILKILNRYTKTLKKKTKGIEFAFKYLQFILPLMFKNIKLNTYNLRIINNISTIYTLTAYTYIVKYLRCFINIYAISYLKLGRRYIGLKKIRAIKRHTRKRLLKQSETIKFKS